MVRITGSALVVVVWGLAFGCSDSKPVVSKEPNRDALTEVGQMLKSLADEGRKPPARAAELEPVEPMLPTAGPLLRDGTLVYLWGAAFAAGVEKVVAHEKKVPSEGGWVLLQNGTVKEMTADQFKTAPKAK